MNDSLIHLRVPAATKGRWIRASRAAGMRLTDWIVGAALGNSGNAALISSPLTPLSPNRTASSV